MFLLKLKYNLLICALVSLDTPVRCLYKHARNYEEDAYTVVNSTELNVKNAKIAAKNFDAASICYKLAMREATCWRRRSGFREAHLRCEAQAAAIRKNFELN
ncbi:MAG: hypothetical protein WC464_03265 [Bdellovibrionales bacterium]